MTVSAKLDGDWWFLFEDEPLDPESSLWTFKGGTVVDSGYPDAPGRHYMKGNVLTIEFPPRSADQSALVATIAPLIPPDIPASERPIDPNFMEGNFTLTVDGDECGDSFVLLRDGPWLDASKRKLAEERAMEAAAGEPRNGDSVEF